MSNTHKSRLYHSLRWIYQPVKGAKTLGKEFRSFLSRTAKLRDYQKAKEFSGLHIGCGPFYLPGWINTDVLGTPNTDFSLDISKPLPLPSNFFDVIYGSEVIEHIELDEARQFFLEAFRILKPGGVIRMTTPDVTEVCRIFLGLRNDVTVKDFGTVWLEGEFSPEIWINSAFRAWGHKHLWTEESFKNELTNVGFTNIEKCEPQETKSDHSQLNNLDNRYGENAPPWIFTSTMIIEASKPKKI